MNLKVNLGKDINNNDFNVDLEKEDIHFIILVGTSGFGKSVFHYNLYKQLIDQNKPEELGFIFFDMTMVDFAGWKSPYVITFIAGDGVKALKKFEEISKKESVKRLIIHIEEMTMLEVSTARFEKALSDTLKNNPNAFVVCSTSRPSNDVLTPKIRSLADLLVVFNLASSEDSKFLGAEGAENFTIPGQHMLILKNEKITCKPLSESDVKNDGDFFQQ